MGETREPVRAQLRSASGRSSKVIRDRQRVEVAVEVPGAGKLVLSVDCEGRYALRTSPGDEEASSGRQLTSGEIRPADRGPG